MRNYAFVHIQKTAGTYVDAGVSRCLILKGYNIFNPWFLSRAEIANLGEREPTTTFGLGLDKGDWRRDWSENELLKIAHIPMAKYVHNHGGNWTEKAFTTFKENQECFFFSFLRNPIDMMCSMYFFLKEKAGEPSDPCWGANDGHPKGLPPTVEEFFQENWMFLDTIIPSFYEKIDYLRIFSEEAMKDLIENVMGGVYKPTRKMNTSENLGWEHYRSTKELSDDSVDRIMSTKTYQLFEELSK